MEKDLYEIHVSINPKNGFDEIRWIRMCKKEGWKYIRHLNSSGEHSKQVMMSKWTHKDTPENAIIKLKEISRKISDNGFEVIRNKVEAMQSNLKVLSYPCYYFEFHIKIKEYELIDKFRELFPSQTYTNYSVSSSGQNKNLIVTIRSKSSLVEATSLKTYVIDVLKSNNFTIIDKVQNEIAFYDDYQIQDLGWIDV